MYEDGKLKIYNFAKKYKRIFIYGAGRYGKVCLYLLKEKDIIPDGFIVSKKRDFFLEDIPIYSFDEVLPTFLPSDGIIIALNEEHQYQVRKVFSEKKIANWLQVEDCTWFSLNKDIVLNKIYSLNLNNPPTPYDGTKRWNKILIIRLDCIGDMVWTTAFIRELKSNFPQAKITLVLRPSIYPLLKNCPYLDEIIVYEYEDITAWPSDEIMKKTMRFAEKYLVQEKFDAVFLPAFIDGIKVENILLAIYSRAKIRIGGVHVTESEDDKKYIRKVSKIFSLLVKHNWQRHHVECILDMLRVIDCDVTKNDMELWVSHNERAIAYNLLRKEENRNLIYIALGIVASKEYRTLSPIKYQRLIKKIVTKQVGKKIRFVLLGGGDAEKAADIAIKGNENDCINLAGKISLNESVAVMEQCNLYVGSNTGLMHIAAALKLPVVTFNYSRTALLDSGPWKCSNIIVYPQENEKMIDCSTEKISINELEEALLKFVTDEKMSI